MTTPTTATGQLTRFSVIGNASLTAIGETSQLTATATFSDGAVRDVTGNTTWASSDSSVIAVAPTGLLTVIRLGAGIITAKYQNQQTALRVSAAPPGLVAVTGSAFEPGQGPVAELRVTDTASTMSTLTDSLGRYSLACSPGSQIHLRFEKDGYERAELDATPGVPADARVQQVVRLVAGETVTPPRLAPSDLTYLVSAGERCSSCRLIRIVVPVQGTLHLQVTWSEPRAKVTLGLWVGGRHVVPTNESIDANVTADPGEMIVYVDRVSPLYTSDHVPFVLTTSLTEQRPGEVR